MVEITKEIDNSSALFDCMKTLSMLHKQFSANLKTLIQRILKVKKSKEGDEDASEDLKNAPKEQQFSLFGALIQLVEEKIKTNLRFSSTILDVVNGFEEYVKQTNSDLDQKTKLLFDDQELVKQKLNSLKNLKKLLILNQKKVFDAKSKAKVAIAAEDSGKLERALGQLDEEKKGLMQCLEAQIYHYNSSLTYYRLNTVRN